MWKGCFCSWQTRGLRRGKVVNSIIGGTRLTIKYGKRKKTMLWSRVALSIVSFETLSYIPRCEAKCRYKGLAKFERVCTNFLWIRMGECAKKWREKKERPLRRKAGVCAFFPTRNDVHVRVYDGLRQIRIESKVQSLWHWHEGFFHW